MANSSRVFPWNTTVFGPLMERPWNFTFVFVAASGVLAFVFNGLTLLLFLTHPTLRRRSFSIFLMYLLTSNMLHVSIQSSLSIVDFKYSYWWLGQTLCIVYYYANNVLTSAPMITHLLISLNRIWAVTFPLSHRRAQTTKMALGLCAALWGYVHIMVLPGMLQRILSMRVPLVIYGCRARCPVHIAVQLMTNVLPLLTMGFAYVYIAYKRHRRATASIETARSSQLTVVNQHGSTSAPTAESGATRKARAKVDSAFLVLTMLTVSAVVCWTPRTVMYLALEVDVKSIIFRVASLLFISQPAIDPLLLAVALKDLRLAFWKRLTSTINLIGKTATCT